MRNIGKFRAFTENIRTPVVNSILIMFLLFQCLVSDGKDENVGRGNQEQKISCFSKKKI